MSFSSSPCAEGGSPGALTAFRRRILLLALVRVNAPNLVRFFFVASAEDRMRRAESNTIPWPRSTLKPNRITLLESPHNYIDVAFPNVLMVKPVEYVYLRPLGLDHSPVWRRGELVSVPVKVVNGLGQRGESIHIRVAYVLAGCGSRLNVKT